MNIPFISRMQRKEAGKRQQRLFFLHFMKAGGTTIHVAIERAYTEGSLCPKRDSFHSSITDTELSQYQLISGHFTLHEARRAMHDLGFSGVVVLRNPIDRLISLYNFLNAHNPDTHPEILDGSHALLPEIRAVQGMDARSFFESDVPHNSTHFNNMYTNVLTNDVSSFLGGVTPRIKEELQVSAAIDALREFRIVGRTEEGLEVVNAVRSLLGLPRIGHIPVLKRTADEMNWHEWMRSIPLLTRETLPAAAMDLVRLDAEVYSSIQ